MNNNRWLKTKSLYEKPFYDKKNKSAYYLQLLNYLYKIPVTFGNSILEVGCGEYPFSQYIPARRRIALDPFSTPTKIKGVEFKKIKIEDLTVKLKFDTVISLNSIDHVDNIDNAIDKINFLTHNGSVFICILNTYYQSWQVKFFSRFGQLIDPPHPHHFTKEGFVKLMKNSGFKLKIFRGNFDSGFKVKDDSEIKNKIIELLTDPRYLLRYLIIKLIRVFDNRPFRPPSLYIFIKV